MATSNAEHLNIEAVNNAGTDFTNPLSAAIAYAMNGLFILPLYGINDGQCGCGRSACKAAGKHPIPDLTPHGFKDATLDVSMLKHWWARYPDANIGIRTGNESGILVVDIDGQRGYDALHDALGVLPDTWHSTTGKGHHFMFRYPGHAIRSATGVIPEVDIRADGAYIVAPPSKHKNGPVYRWVVGPSAPLLECPDGLLQILTDARSTGKVHDRHVDPIEGIVEGQRNSTLFAFGRRMKCMGATSETILAAIREQNRALCQPPLDDNEVTRLAQNAFSLADNGDFVSPISLLPFRSALPSTSGGLVGNDFAPISVAELLRQADEKTNWVFQDYLPVGGLILLAAKPKMGKTTLVYHLVAHIAQGLPFLKRDTTRTGVLILELEEHGRDVRNRLRDLGAKGFDNVYLQFGRLDNSALEYVKEFIIQNQIGLVVVDTLAAYWNVTDENNAAQVTA